MNKNTFHVILSTILLFLFGSIWWDTLHSYKLWWLILNIWQRSWKGETCLSSHLVCSDGLSHCQNGADYRYLSMLSHATQWKGNAPTIACIVLRIVIFLLLVRDNRIQSESIHFSQVISYLFSCENRCCLSETRLGQFTLVGSLRQWYHLIERHLLIDRNPTPTIE